MLTVDNFMKINNRFYLNMHDFNERHSAKAARSFIPSLSPEQCDDMYGLNEQDIETGTSFILPNGSYDKLIEHRNIKEYVRSNPYLVEIISECPCNDPYKIKHHPDYSDPNRVVLLCRKCHGAEHARINRQKKQMLISMIAVKMLINTPSAPASLKGDDTDGRGTQYPALDRAADSREHRRPNLKQPPSPLITGESCGP